MTVIPFGNLTEILQTVTISQQGVNNTEGLKNYLMARYPALSSMTFVLAVNNRIVNDTVVLAENDTIALLPPFSGG